jgi:hypothetical protein
MYRVNKVVFIFQLLFFTCFITGVSWSQSAIHQWKYYVNSSRVTDVAILDNQIFAALENGVYQYDASKNESTLWTVTDYLSDIYVSKVFSEKYTNSCWIGYKNGNIDFITGSTVSNIPYLKMSDKMGDKSIVAFQQDGKFIYAACSFGILKLDPKKKEVKDTYFPPLKGAKIKDIIFFGDSIFALSDTLIFSADKNNPLLANEKNWKTTRGSSFSYKKFHLFQNQLFLESNTQNLLIQDGSLWKTIVKGYFSEKQSYDNLVALTDEWAVIGYDGIQLLDASFEEKEIIYRYDGKYVPRPNVIIKSNATYWIGDRECGLVFWKDNFNNQVLKINFLPKSSVFSIGYIDGQVGVTSGVTSKVGFQYNAEGVYINLGEEWKLFDRYNQTKWKNKLLFDIGSIAFNPKKKGGFAVGSNSFVPLSISNTGKQIDTVFTDSNSILDKSILGNGFTFVSDLLYDKEGNLWVVNPYSSNPLKVYSAQHKWTEIPTSGATSNSWASKIKLDYAGNKWVIFPGIGVVGINTNNTLETISDDVIRIVNDGETSGALPTKDINAIALDFDNNLWVGTDEGFAIVYNAPAILNGEGNAFTSQRIKLQYEGNVEYLLGKTSISDIEIDGGNRKWIATTNAGLFLLSADGNQLLQSFTKENGTLISNNISDIQFNHQTGELFIVTDMGLVSYRADASEGKQDYETTLVFPNPYKPEHSKGITIQGIKYDSDIKVTDAAGNVVYKTTSNGGTAFWNALDWEGNRVTPGVYFFWTAPNDANVEGKKVGKVVVF